MKFPTFLPFSKFSLGLGTLLAGVTIGVALNQIPSAFAQQSDVIILKGPFQNIANEIAEKCNFTKQIVMAANAYVCVKK